MKLDVSTIEGKKSGSVDLADDIFGLEPRSDILQRMVRYQLMKRMAGTHKSKQRSEISGTGAKWFKQKGTGRARHGNRKANLFRGGGKAFGPVVRSHAISLPKKVRALALKHALSTKASSEQLVVLDKAEIKEAKTKELRNKLNTLGLENALIIDGESVNEDFARAARNIPQVDVLPAAGINVYDILRRDKLVLTKDAVDILEARLK